MNEHRSKGNLDHLASKLSDELEELKKMNANIEQVHKAIVLKDELLKEIKAFLEQRNKDVK